MGIFWSICKKCNTKKIWFDWWFATFFQTLLYNTLMNLIPDTKQQQKTIIDMIGHLKVNVYGKWMVDPRIQTFRYSGLSPREISRNICTWLSLDSRNFIVFRGEEDPSRDRYVCWTSKWFLPKSFRFAISC